MERQSRYDRRRVNLENKIRVKNIEQCIPLIANNRLMKLWGRGVDRINSSEFSSVAA